MKMKYGKILKLGVLTIELTDIGCKFLFEALRRHIHENTSLKNLMHLERNLIQIFSTAKTAASRPPNTYLIGKL